jgi:L-lysine exporter family protein LysE/ArgO
VTAFVYGLLTGFGLIVAIGAQNVFVLRQGIARGQVLAVAATAALCDALLILTGVAGVGGAIANSALLATVTAAGGVAFLIVYGVLSLRSAFRGQAVRLDEPSGRALSVRSAVGATLAISLLNPHVYLDTIVLLGGIGSQLEGPLRWRFAGGAVTASTLWFFGLAYGARALAPLFQRQATTRALDVFVAAVMFFVAAYLVRELL